MGVVLQICLTNRYPATMPKSGTRSLAAALTALVVAASVSCQSTIRVAPVNYSFKTPLVVLPLGLPAPVDRREAFAEVFCKALQLDPAHAGDDCSKYLELDRPV